MIDIQPQVYSSIETEVMASFPNATMSALYVNKPSSFPHIRLIETKNIMSHLDTSDEQKFATLQYDVNVFANSEHPMSEARSIMSVIDKRMYELGFTCVQMLNVPNEDTTIYRLSATYEADTDGTNIFRR